MNPVIKYYKNSRAAGGEFLTNLSIKDRAEEILAVLDSATKEQHDEFLAWTEHLPLTKKQIAARKWAEEERKRLEWEAIQNPSESKNTKYAG